ncbi:rhombosortase [Actomonas aquatica]|uniref:Rhombosortase n=1 Tax=Actomonas aquatica TaxID=2866162 RepID=A0ABZ1C6G7_9BACT|nr:rhombosortase [Opitutus sp. WL0086]WRQ87314.1 rhombosortase [Opitutus sp. WL0086]
MKRFPFLTCGLAALAVAIALIPGATELFQFDRSAALGSVQWSRLFTAHLTHFEADHLRWDVLALLLLGTLAERTDRRATALTLLLAAPAIGLGVLLFQPHFDTYRGLSGLDSALYGLITARLLVDGWRERHDFTISIAALALIGFVLKTGFELLTAETVFSDSLTFAPVPLAHLIGLGVGCAVAFGSQAPNLDNPLNRHASFAH